MRTLLVLSLLAALTLSGCATVADPDAEAAAAAERLTHDMGSQGDLARMDLAMEMVMDTDDFRMVMGLAAVTDLLQGDAMRMTVGITKAVFDGDDQSERMEDVEIYLACDPTVYTLRLTGMEAMGGEDAHETIPNELGTCLDVADEEAMERQMEAFDAVLDGQFAGLFTQLLDASRAVDLELSSAKAVGGGVEATYTLRFEEITMEMVASIHGGRFTSTRMDYTVDEVGMSIGFVNKYHYGPRDA